MKHLDHDPLLSATEASVDRFTGLCRRRSGKPLSRKRFATTPIDREIGQQDLDERSKHLTERGPFVNGARSNLAAAHGRGLHPTGAPINVAVSRFAFCRRDHRAARLKLHLPASSCRTDLIKQGRASAGRSWSHSDSRMAAAASSPPCVAPVDPLLMTARNMDDHQASWDHTPRRQR